MILDRIQILGRAVHPDAIDFAREHRNKKVREAHDVVEVGMRQKDVQVTRRQAIGDTKERGPRVEDDPQLGQHDTRGVPPFVRVISAGAEEAGTHIRRAFAL